MFCSITTYKSLNEKGRESTKGAGRIVDKIIHLSITMLTIPYSFSLNMKSLQYTRLKVKVSTDLSRIVRKPDFCLCANKDADQLCSAVSAVQ